MSPLLHNSCGAKKQRQNTKKTMCVSGLTAVCYITSYQSIHTRMDSHLVVSLGVYWKPSILLLISIGLFLQNV